MGDSPSKRESDGATSDRTIDFDTGIPFLVASLGNKLSAIASAHVRRELGVGLMEWRILALLAVEKEATPARVGQIAGVDKSVVSRAATSLERRGMIAIASEPSASRQTRFSMTSEGAEVHARGVSLAYANNDALLHGFTAEERMQLAGLLRRAAANLPRLEPKNRR
jgi:DNA-binding MarR family transcriptional regulator